MIRVGYNARLLHDERNRGWNRYAVNLLAELGRMGVDLRLYSDQPIARTHLDRIPQGSYHVEVSPPMKYFRWLRNWLPERSRLDALDLFHTPYNLGLPARVACPRVLTLHDAIDQQNTTSWRIWRTARSSDELKSAIDHWSSRRFADRIITVSESARSELVRVLGIRPEKISVIAEAADPHFAEHVSAEAREGVRARLGLPDRYLFYVGGLEERKNIPFLLRAFAAARVADLHLVLGGGRDHEQNALTRLGESLGLGDRLRFLGWVHEADLPALYAESLAFVYPSRHEGFGLQLCEAMAVGTPCLAARASSLPEVLGDGGVLFGLDDPGELTALIRRVAGEPTFRADLEARARARSKAFSWQQTAEKTLDLYRTLVAARA